MCRFQIPDVKMSCSECADMQISDVQMNCKKAVCNDTSGKEKLMKFLNGIALNDSIEKQLN